MNNRKLALGVGVTAAVLAIGAAGIGAASASETPVSHPATGPAPFVDRDGNVYTGPVNQAQGNGDTANAVISTTVVPLIQSNIQVPQGLALKTAYRATGQQIYRCSAGQWVFDHPDANSTRFVGGSNIGFHHDRGPVWTETGTEFTVRGQSAASAGGNQDDIPQLLLRVVEQQNPRNVGSIYSEITYIQRLDTDGGTVSHISTACTSDNEGATEGVDYSALYAFFGPSGSNG